MQPWEPGFRITKDIARKKDKTGHWAHRLAWGAQQLQLQSPLDESESSLDAAGD